MLKRISIILSAVLMLAACVQRGGEVREFEGLELQSSVLGIDVPYSVVLPKDYSSSNKSYPVLYMFHCIGGDSTTGIEYCNITDVLDSLVGAREIEPMIVVMPDIFMSYAADTYDGSFRYETMLMTELLPKIDADYRTSGQRFTLGFSMGGFASISTALRNRDKFLGFAALSPSVRTDDQYMAEPQDGWESQWGRIFGGMGKTGEERITRYYTECSPIYLFENLPEAELESMSMFMEVGNREGGSLCASNEALHQTLLRRAIPHEWSVSDGGHDFAHWRKVLPDALRFASASFQGKRYMPKVTPEPARSAKFDGPSEIDGARLYMPKLGYGSTRQFPTVYVFGATGVQERTIMEYYTAMRLKGAATPIAFCFMDEATADAVHGIEGHEPALRQSQRMRSAICIGEARELQLALCEENLFTNVVFVNPTGTINNYAFASIIGRQRRYPKLIIAVDSNFEGYSRASDLHVMLKEEGLSHTYYSYPEGSGEILRHLPEWLSKINYKFHD